MKVFTALIGLEQFGEDETITISENASQQGRPSGGLRSGTQWKMVDLLAGLLLAGNNDATVAIADAAAERSGKDFETLASDIASQLGLSGTTTNTAIGNGDDTISPRDLAIISRNLMAYSTANDLAKMAVYRTKDPDGYDIQYHNTNQLVGVLTDAVGLFTSGLPTKGAGIVAITNSGDRQLLAVAMGMSNPYQKIASLLADAPKNPPADAKPFPAPQLVSYSTRDQIARAMPQVLGGGRPGSADPGSGPALTGVNSSSSSSVASASAGSKSSSDDGIGFGTIFLLLLLALTIAILIRRQQIKIRKRQRRASAMRMYEKERRYLQVYRGSDLKADTPPLRPALKPRIPSTETNPGHVRLIKRPPRNS